MSEMAKTWVFVGVAILALGAAVLSRPTPPPVDESALMVSKNLNVLEDPLAAQELEIIRWDPALGDASTFKVARVDGLWTIPSHANYPADADRQMGDAATAATNLKPLGVASTKSVDHEMYGVVDPESAKPGATGVGTRVLMKDSKGETLVSTIIGKEVKGESGQRYVRQVGKDPVYIVKIDPAKLSTKFEDWIEKDLLKINAFDISKVKINDYSVKLAPTQNGLGLIDNRRGEIELAFDDAKSVWSVEKLMKWDETEREMVPEEIPPGEEVNNVKLNDMKSALADLKIIDVQRKPAGMTPDLKLSGNQVANNQQMRDLMKRGFYAVGIEDGAMELLSSEGDFVVEEKNGVQYVLRFGGIRLGSDAAEGEEESDPADAAKRDAKGENRYLFVAARFNPDAIPEPVKPAILQDAAEDDPPADEKDVKPAGGNASDDAPAEESAPAEKPESAPADDAPAAAPQAETSESSAQLTLDQQDGGAVDAPDPAQPAEPAAQPPASATEDPADQPADAPAGEAKSDEPATVPTKEESTGEEPKSAAKSADAPATGEQAPADQPAAQPDDAAAQRAAAEMKYNREMDEYQDKVEKAQQRVKELNDRFANWYYVISDDVFKKIHITRADLFVAKPADPAVEQEKNQTSIPLNTPDSIDAPDSPNSIETP